MTGLSRFSDEEIQRMKRLNSTDGKSYNCIAQIINHDRPSHRFCTSHGVRTCLKRLSAPVVKKRVYKLKLGSTAISFVDAEVNADREISARELQMRLHENINVDVSVSVINRERRRMGWVQKNTRYCQMIRAENKVKRLFYCTNI